jgi:hypothetical protein
MASLDNFILIKMTYYHTCIAIDHIFRKESLNVILLYALKISSEREFLLSQCEVVLCTVK